MSKRIKIGLFLNDANLSTNDLTQPELGNPGIGGTQFNFITLPYYYNQVFENEVEWIFIDYGNLKLPSGFTKKTISSETDVAGIFSSKDLDYFIWKPGDEHGMIELIEKYNQKAISWCHNIPGPRSLNALAKSKNIKRVVFAGHEALDIIRDHSIINKSTVIWNGFDSRPYQQNEALEKDPNSIVFLGSLHEGKCFHLLAEAWPEVIIRRPKAHLSIIGSGKLYSHKLQMGTYNLAETSYEKRFMKPLIDSSGNINPSVSFLGLLGKDKIPLLQKATVGIINPHGKSEVCPGSAIEFQACKTPVIAGARYGNLDVIEQKKTGFLVKNKKELTSKIIYCLDHPEKVQAMGVSGASYVETKFNQTKIMTDWKTLIEELKHNKKPSLYPMKTNWFYNLKVVFEILRIIKFRLGVFRKAPAIYEYIEIKKGNVN